MVFPDCPQAQFSTLLDFAKNPSALHQSLGVVHFGQTITA